jgi:ureidoglycolate lyase
VSDAEIALTIEPLHAKTFAPFGNVIDAANAQRVIEINEGTAQRFHDLARIDCDSDDGRVVVSIFRAQPRALPFQVTMLERHPLGSQAFVPLDPSLRYLVVVASSPQELPRAFLASRGQGINLHRGVWHHPLLALDRRSDFLVIDRGGGGNNCDEAALALTYTLPNP